MLATTGIKVEEAELEELVRASFEACGAAAKQLWHLSRESSVLIADERNFSYITRNQDKILKGEFRYSGRVIYCGQKIRGRPIHVSEDCVRFGYFAGLDLVGTLDMHPFREGELREDPASCA